MVPHPLTASIRRLSLREHQTAPGVPLNNEQCDALRLLVPDLAVTPSVHNPGAYDLTPGSTVGVVETDSLAVSIRPKIPLHRLLFLVSYALDPRAWRDRTAGFADADGIVEAFVPGFVRQIRSALAAGASHGYRPTEDAPYTVRGRIRFGDQIRRRYGNRLPVEVAYDDFTVDTDENRVIKAAVHRLGRMRIRSEGARRSLRAFDGRLDGVSLMGYDRRSLPRFTWTRLNEHYRGAVELSLLVLRATSIESLPGGRRSSALLLDMNKVFEDFAVVALREALRLGPSELVQHGRRRGLSLDVAGRVKLHPDISWWEGDRCVFVGDVKYKRLAPAGAPNADLYQLLAYLTATGLRAGLLVYAAGEADEAEHTVAGTDQRLLVQTLDVDGPPDDVLGAIRSLAERLESLRLPRPRLA